MTTIVMPQIKRKAIGFFSAIVTVTAGKISPVVRSFLLFMSWLLSLS